MANAKVVLNKEQSDALNTVLSGESVFITGCAGTGKSVLVKEIVNQLQQQTVGNELICVTAFTARAALQISGTTLHRFAGIGLGQDDAQKYAEKIPFMKKVASRWVNAKVLLIDEVSMISGTLLDKLEFIAKKVRKIDKPFGGIQLVLVGDLLQLPPIREGEDEVVRVWESECWRKCIKKYIPLHTVMRQSDMDFIAALTCIRVGAPTRSEVVEFVKRVSRKKIYDDDSGPVDLFAIKSKTDYHNMSELNKIEGECRVYTSNDYYVDTNKSTIRLLDSCPAPPELSIKIGAQVMLIKNLTSYLVNGTVGIVIAFTRKLDGIKPDALPTESLESVPIVKFSLANGRVYTRPLERQSWDTVLPGGQVQASRSQIPLILAWAVTIHKSQGQTIQRVRVDLAGVFDYGQVYTALSRAVSIDTLEVINFDPTKVIIDEKSLNFCVDNGII